MRQSAGLLLFRRRGAATEVLLAHPGGPIWRKRDEGAWTIPKGEPNEGEELLDAARREFAEELGSPAAASRDDFIALTPVRQPGGKIVHAFALEADFDPNRVSSNVFSMEWPPRSGRQQSFPEIDRAAWFALEVARTKILAGQAPLLDELTRLV
jgi:predicted NUDIX family NTP pyrophosphohydrolase